MPINRKRFFTTAETLELTNLSRSRLMELKRSGDFQAGKHYVYLGGTPRSKLGWDIEQIHSWMVEQTKKELNSPSEAIAQMETFAEVGV